MRSRSSLLWVVLLASVLGCETKGDEDGRTRAEWIALCESQTSASACEAVASETHDGETWRCESVIVVKTSAPDCISAATDSRCLAVSDVQPGEAGYVLSEGDELWLVEGPPNTTVHGSAIASCSLDADGVTWTPDAVCECAGKVTDDEGGW